MSNSDMLKETVGAQDQVAAAYGGFNRINFLTDGSIDVQRIMASQDRINDLQENLALVLHRLFAHRVRSRDRAGEGDSQSHSRIDGDVTAGG